MKQKRSASIALVVLLTSIFISGAAMGFRPLQICLFSEVNAVVTLNGQPVAGVEIVRTANELDSKVYTEKTTTDDQGRFHFDALWAFSLRGFIPANPMVEQHITILHQGRDYMGWQHSKNGYGHNEELDDNKPLSLTCELSEEPVVRYQEVAGNIKGICKW